MDALVLLGNGNVVYATGASWPLLDAGPVPRRAAGGDRARRRRAPAPVHAVPRGRGGRSPSCPPTTCTAPLYLEFDEGVEHFARVLADLVRPGATVAVDEMTGAMRRAGDRLFPAGRRRTPHRWSGPAKLVKTSDQISCIRKACRITEEAVVEVQKSLAPGIRQIDLSAQFVRRAFELGATANMLEAIWQVMPNSKAEGTWTTTGDLALPLLTTERELAKGDVLWTDVSITYHGYCSDFGRTWLVGDAADGPPAGSVPQVARHPRCRVEGHQGRRDVG